MSDGGVQRETKSVKRHRDTVYENDDSDVVDMQHASLDTVLWPELGWQKVGMHELVTPAQVKIRYTKAIAKLHPDKVCRILIWSYVSLTRTHLCLAERAQYDAGTEDDSEWGVRFIERCMERFQAVVDG